MARPASAGRQAAGNHIETERTGSDLDALPMIAENWNAVGVKTALKSMTRDAFWPRATGNHVQISVWGTDRGLEPFVRPIYVSVRRASWMAPAYGVWYKTGRQRRHQADGKLAEVQGLFDQFKATIDPTSRSSMGKQMVKTATEELWTIQTVGMSPVPRSSRTTSATCRTRFTQDWIIMSPGTLDPSHFFLQEVGGRQVDK